jgi:hypothetical protein
MGHSYWLVLLSASTFFVGYEDLADRSSLVSTYFLSLIAFMFVVDESLPKLDFATRIDKVIMVSVSLVASTGLASVLVEASLGPSNEPTLTARLLNVGGVVLLLLTFAGANVYILLPAFLKRRKATELLRGIKTIRAAQTGLQQERLELFGDADDDSRDYWALPQGFVSKDGNDDEFGALLQAEWPPPMQADVLPPGRGGRHHSAGGSE